MVHFFILLLPLVAWAGEFTAFGPKNFIRETSSPVKVACNFSVVNPSTEFILRVYNGGLQDSETELVSASVISINGIEVLGPRDFNQTVRFIEKPLTLQSQNIIEVEVVTK